MRKFGCASLNAGHLLPDGSVERSLRFLMFRSVALTSHRPPRVSGRESGGRHAHGTPTMRHTSRLAPSSNITLKAPADRPIYYFDVVHDYPAIGGIVEFSQILFKQLKKRYGRRLVSATEAGHAARRFRREHALYRPRAADCRTSGAVDPDATFFFPNYYLPIARKLERAAHDHQRRPRRAVCSPS